MKKLVFFPSDPLEEYIKKGRNLDFLYQYYNPGYYFDEVYCLSPWGNERFEEFGNIHCIKAKPYEFKKIIQQINPDVIRGYGGYCCADWVAVSKVDNIPAIVSVHDTNPKLIHKTLKYADAILCVSDAVKNAVKKVIPDYDDNKIWILPNRIDVELFKNIKDEEYFRKLNGIYGEGRHILHIGRKTEQKNLDTLIKSMQFLSNDVSCIFIGRGETDKYIKMAEELKVKDRCYFIDSVDNKQLPYWYSWADCMCTPSRWEGFGYVFIEAAACEAIIVTSDISPMNEYLQDGINSCLVKDYENPQAIAKKIEFILENNEKVEIIKHNARKVGERFSKEEIDKKEISYYSAVIDENIQISSGNRGILFYLFVEDVIYIINKEVRQFIKKMIRKIV